MKKNFMFSWILCTLYVRNSSDILKEQIGTALDTVIYFQTGPQAPYFYPMSKAVNISTCNVAEKHINVLQNWILFGKRQWRKVHCR